VGASGYAIPAGPEVIAALGVVTAVTLAAGLAIGPPRGKQRRQGAAVPPMRH